MAERPTQIPDEDDSLGSELSLETEDLDAPLEEDDLSSWDEEFLSWIVIGGIAVVAAAAIFFFGTDAVMDFLTGPQFLRTKIIIGAGLVLLIVIPSWSLGDRGGPDR